MSVTGFEVELFTISAAPNVLDKNITLETGVKVTAHPTQACSILNPSLIVDNVNSVLGKNYLYIAAFGRFYFIDEPIITTGQRVILPCTVDALYSFKDSIRACSGVCLRSESLGMSYFPDAKYPLQTNKRYIELKNYDTPFTYNPSYPYVLTTIGGDAQ